MPTRDHKVPSVLNTRDVERSEHCYTSTQFRQVYLRYLGTYLRMSRRVRQAKDKIKEKMSPVGWSPYGNSDLHSTSLNRFYQSYTFRNLWSKAKKGFVTLGNLPVLRSGHEVLRGPRHASTDPTFPSSDLRPYGQPSITSRPVCCRHCFLSSQILYLIYIPHHRLH